MAAIYTTPRTWTAAELVTASIMNTHVRDNLDFMFNGKTAGQTAHNLGPYTTTSTSVVDVNAAMSITQTITTGRALVTVAGRLTITGAGAYTVTLNLLADGTTYAIQSTSGAVSSLFYQHLVTSLSVGSKIFKLQWSVTNALGTATWTGASGDGSPITFNVVEI